MTTMGKMESFSNQQSSYGIMVEEKQDFPSSNSSSSVESSESDLFGEVNSPSLSSFSSQHGDGPLQDMSSLLHQLPIKRGLSKHYNGKSQSFTSLSSVTCLADLAKPENSYNKKPKSCKSYGGLLEEASNKSGHPLEINCRGLAKKTSRGSFSSLNAKRNPSFLGNRPPVPIPQPHRSTSASNFANRTPLFA